MLEKVADIESENLAAHTVICQQRYHHLDMRIQQIEKRIEKIEELVTDIHKKIDDLAHNQNTKWDKGQIAIIAVLMSVVGYLFSKVLA